MEEQLAPDASTVVTTTEAPAPTTTDANAGDRPETMAEALGEDGPGIAAEIESELASMNPQEPAPATEPGTADGPIVADPAVTGDRLGILADLQVTLSARLCATSQPLGAVLSMKPGTIVDLGRSADAPIELLANGVVVAVGEVVAVGSSLGVRVTAIAPSK